MSTRYRNKSTPPEMMQLNFVDYLGNEYPSSWQSLSREETMTDVVDPGFHARRAKGEVFNNPCTYVSASVTAVDTGSSHYKFRPGSNPLVWIRKTVGNYTLHALNKRVPYLWNVNEAVDPTFDAESQSKQRSLARVDSTPYDFFEDFAELSETLRFLRNPIASLAKVAKLYKTRARKIREGRYIHGDTPEWRRKEAKALADLWNTTRFAAMPLARSIMTAIEAYNDKDGTRPTRRTASGTSNAEAPSVIGMPEVLDGPFLWKHRKVSDRSIHGHATIYYEVSNPLYDWQFKLGLRFKDIPTVLWEVVPLSFMIDRLIDIKSAISGAMNLLDPNVTILAASYTARKTHVHTLSCIDQWYLMGEWKTVIENADTVEFKTFYYTRQTWLPSWSDTVPPINWRGHISSVSNLLDLLAVTISRLA